MRMWIVILLIIVVVISGGCSNNFGSHAIQCTIVGEQKICFIREVWGFNGESLSLSTSDNVCHKASSEDDYIADRLRGDDVIRAKIADGKIYIYAVRMKAPKNPFPVEVVLEEYNPLTYFDRDFIKEGYQEFDLGKGNMTWCFKDVL